MEFNPRPDPIEAGPAGEIKASRDGGPLEQKLGEAAMVVSQPETSNDHRETPDRKLNRYKEAIELYARGASMRQASLEMDMSANWLSAWSRNHPEELEALLAESLEEVGLEKRVAVPHRPHRSLDPDRHKKAIGLYAQGVSMEQASLRMDMNASWLSLWRRNHPEEFETLLAEFLEKAGLDEIPDNRFNRHKKAIELYARGASMREASLRMDMNASWLDGWARNHPEEFETLVTEYPGNAGLEKRIAAPRRSPRHLDPDRAPKAIELYAQGVSMEQASLKMDMSTGWLGQWRRNHPEEFEALLAEYLEKAGLENRVAVPPSLDRAQKAVELYVGGATMRQASLEMDMSANWLSAWRRNHSEVFREFHDQVAVENSHKTIIEKAFTAYVSGESEDQVDSVAGMSPGWFIEWRDKNPNLFTELRQLRLDLNFLVRLALEGAPNPDEW